MKEIKKTHFDVAGSTLALEVPFAKVDTERRIVSGFATLDNVDTQGDVVTAEASVEAFANSRRNLRESHTNIAVGKVVDWREQEYYDADNDQMYRGIYVDAYISKGSPNVWEKVLDGTLAAFSIGGSVVESKSEMRKSGDSVKQVRVISKYKLTELSICDAGANQLANVFSIQKVAGGDDVVVEGDAVDVDLRNVLYCKTDGRAIKTTLETADCTVCGKPMENIGWFEVPGSEEESVAKVRELVKTYKESEEGGNTLADETKELEHGDNPEVNTTVDSAEVDDLNVEEATKTESDDQIVDVPSGAEATETEEEVKEEEKVEEEPVKEEESPSEEVAKTISEFRDKITETLEKVSNEQKAQLDSLNEKFAKLSADVEPLRAQGEELTKRLDALQGQVTEVEKNLGVVSKSTASKKSGDLGGSPEGDTLEKSAKPSFWGGNFSVDSL